MIQRVVSELVRELLARSIQSGAVLPGVGIREFMVAGTAPEEGPSPESLNASPLSLPPHFELPVTSEDGSSVWVYSSDSPAGILVFPNVLTVVSGGSGDSFPGRYELFALRVD